VSLASGRGIKFSDGVEFGVDFVDAGRVGFDELFRGNGAL
jgi:hypothetical protein